MVKIIHGTMLMVKSASDDHIRGDYIWDEDDFTIIFDVYTQDFGNDGLAGDYFIDEGENDTI